MTTWPVGDVARQVAILDDRLARCAAALKEARANHELSVVAVIEQRRDELLDQRLRLIAPRDA